MMGKPKRKLTAAERHAKKERNQNYQTIFMHGKQVRVRRPPTIDGMPVDEFIACNADELWLHQNEMWEFIDIEPEAEMDEDHARIVEEARTGPPPRTAVAYQKVYGYLPQGWPPK